MYKKYKFLVSTLSSTLVSILLLLCLVLNYHTFFAFIGAGENLSTIPAALPLQLNQETRSAFQPFPEVYMDVYLNPGSGDDSLPINSLANPARTIERAMDFVADNGTIHIMEQPIDILSDKRIDLGASRNIRLKRYEIYNGTMFRISGGATLTLQNLILSGETNTSAYQVINVVEGKLVLSEGVSLINNGMIAMSNVSASPIELAAQPAPGSVFTLITDPSGVTETLGRVLVSAGIVPNAIEYFALGEPIATEFELRENDNGDIALYKKRLTQYNGVVFLSGSGDDNNDGSGPDRPVRTYQKAYELFSLLNAGGTPISHISICGEVPVNNEAWNDVVDIMRYEGYYGNLILVSDGEFVLNGPRIGNNGFGASVVRAGGSQTITLQGGRIEADNGTGILISGNGTLNLNNGAIHSNRLAVHVTGAKADQRIRIDGEKAIIDGPLFLDYNGQSYAGGFIKITSPRVTQNYRLILGFSIFQDAPQYASGSNIVSIENNADISPYQDRFTLETTSSYGFSVYRNNMVVYDTKGVYVNGLLGSDDNNGLSPSQAVRSIFQAGEAVLDNPNKDTIYICDESIVISESFSVNLPNVTIKRFNYLNPIFTIPSGSQLALNFITLDGESKGAAPLVTIEGGELTMDETLIHASPTHGVVLSSGTLTMNSGAITNNNLSPQNSQQDGGILVTGGTFQMNGGSITNNTKLQSGFGQQVSLLGGFMDMRGGSVYNSDEGANVIYVALPATLRLYNASDIRGMVFCTNAVSGVNAPLSLGEPLLPGKTFTLNLPDIMVRKRVVEGSLIEPSLVNFNLNPSISSFQLVKNGKHIYAGASMVYLAGTASTNAIQGNDSFDGSTPQKAVATFQRAREILSQRYGAWIIIVDTVEIAGSEEWDLSSIPWETMIQRASGFDKRPLIRIRTGNSLSLRNITLDGNKETTTSQEPILVVEGGSLTLQEGALITNAKSVNNGGAIGVLTGNLVMNGGRLTGNLANYGGAVFVNNGGSFTMNLGEIDNNAATVLGGGVFLDRQRGSTSTIFTMVDGLIHDNTARHGGGVSLENTSTFQFKGGGIYNNRVTGVGGGVNASGSGCRFIMSGGEIHSNTSEQNGGGVFSNTGNCLFTGTGGVIRDNLARWNGGGIYSNHAPMVISGITIRNNTASLDGGGIYLNMLYMATNNTFTMNSGLIEKNLAKHGGGIFAYTSSVRLLKINGGTISQNEASVNGGGLYMAGHATLVGTGGLVEDNTAADSGGGIFFNYANHELRGMTINANKALTAGGVFILGGSTKITGETKIINNIATEKDGGGIYVSMANLEVSSGEIAGNTAFNNGGGLFVALDSSLQVSGGRISLNEASNGGGLFIQDGAVTLSDGLVSENRAANGGGVYLNGSCILNAEGGSIFSNETANETVSPSLSGEVHYGEGSLNVRRGNCFIGGTIYMKSGKQITITGALLNTSNVYRLYSEDTTPGAKLVVPSTILIGDASQYIRRFVLGNKQTLPDGTVLSNNLELGKSNVNLVVVSCYYLNGQQLNEGYGLSPADSFKTLASLLPIIDSQSYVNIYVCGQVDVSDSQELYAKGNDVSFLRYDGHEVHGATYSEYLGDMFYITPFGNLTLRGLTLSGNSGNVTNVSGSILHNKGTLNLLENTSLMNARSSNPGAGIYQDGTLNLSDALAIHTEVYLAVGEGTADTGGRVINVPSTSIPITPTIPISIENPYPGRILVTYPDIVGEPELIKYRLMGTATLQYRMITSGSYLVLEPYVSSFIITKKLDSPATEDERFVFKVVYNAPNPRTFYVVILLEAGQSVVSKSIFAKILGLYTVTDLQSNWRYTPMVKEQSYEVKAADPAPYEFIFESFKEWPSFEKDTGAPSDKGNATNVMSHD